MTSYVGINLFCLNLVTIKYAAPEGNAGLRISVGLRVGVAGRCASYIYMEYLDLSTCWGKHN
jgi:hypothetical protein